METQVLDDQRLWGWFGLSYASFLTLPRVLMHAMPSEWQNRMCDLLEEYDAANPNPPELGTRVQVTRDGKMCTMPEWLINYRRPDYAKIAEVKGELK